MLVELDEREGFLHNAGGVDGFHAAMVDGAFAEKARAAFDRFAYDAGEGPGGTGGDVVGGAEDGDGGDAECAGDVHGAGIVGEEGAAGGGDGDELVEFGFAGKVVGFDAGGGDLRLDLVAEGAFIGGAEQGYRGGGLPGETDGGLGKAIGEPAFGGTVGGAGADADPVAGELAVAEEGLAVLYQVRDAGEADGIDGGDAVNEAGAAEEFEVVEALVVGDFAGFGWFDRVREEETAGIAGEADAGGDAGSPDEGGRIKGVGEEDGAVKVHAAQLPGEGEFGGKVAGAAGEVIGEDVVDEGFVVESGDPGAGEEGDMGLGKMAAEFRERGDAHDGVTNPIGGPYEDTTELHAL